jgi:hypothetical protein
MKVEIYKPNMATDNRGNFCLWYGKSGVGKSATVLQTAADPIMHILAERGQEDLTIKAINRPDIKLKTAYYEGWDDLLEFLYDLKNFEKIKSLLFDSLTHVMNIRLKDEILEENFDAREQENKKTTEKDLTTRVKGTQEMYGALSNQMFRLMTAFEYLTIHGIDIHCTARDQENPKWDRALACAPALAGKEFPRDMKGFFDFTGLVESRFDDKGEIVYPPVVSCDDDGSYISKWTGVKPPGGVIKKPFNVQKLLDVAHGRNVKGGN